MDTLNKFNILIPRMNGKDLKSANEMALTYSENRNAKFAIYAPTKEEAIKAIEHYKKIVFPRLEGANLIPMCSDDFRDKGYTVKRSTVIVDDIEDFLFSTELLSSPCGSTPIDPQVELDNFNFNKEGSE